VRVEGPPERRRRTIEGVHRIEIDGVPVFSAAGPDRATAALMFGVGIRDESYPTLGITHLVEHLVMGSLPKSHLDSNAMVDLETTVFHATGRPEAVQAFLAGVCAALADLPTDRIEREIGVLQAEDCAGTHPTAAALWAARFGLAGPGLALGGGGVPDKVSEDDVRAHAGRWFVRGNAALIWHGELPPDLRLPLPEGPVPERPRPQPRPQAGPAWLEGPTPGVGLLLTSAEPLNSPLSIAVDVLQERMRDLARHERGLSYHADVHIVDVAPAHREIALVVDAREGQEGAVAGLLWEQYLDLGEHGPSAAELEHAIGGFAAHLDSGDEAVAADLSRAAFSELFALPHRTGAEVLTAWRAVQPAQIAEALRATRASAVLVVPNDVEPGELGGGIRRGHLCDPVAELPPGVVFRPPLLARARYKAARLTLVVNDDVVAHRDAEGELHQIAWSEVVAAVPAEEGDGVAVVGRNVCVIEVHEEVYGRRAVQAVRARVPAHLHVRAPRPADAGEREPVPAV
jgi:hypothetical protein